MELGIAVMTKVAHGLSMSKGWVRQLYVSDSCLNSAVTDEQRGQNYDGWIV
jgi:hypothetical protein